MEREIMLYCVEGGVGPGAYVAGRKYPANEVLSHEQWREDAYHVTVWGADVHGVEMIGIEQYLGRFDYAVMEA
ncbi:TPA: hypothetical protein ACHJ1A_001626 [Escherichia coli]